MRSARRLDEQLEFGISDYALAGRADWLDRLLNHAVVNRNLAELAAATREPRAAPRGRGYPGGREIAPFF